MAECTATKTSPDCTVCGISCMQVKMLQARVEELENERKLTLSLSIQQESHLEYQNRKMKKVVEAAKELVNGKSADSIDTDEYPELEKALKELTGVY